MNDEHPVVRYLRTLKLLRSNAADPARDAYTVAIGQLAAHKLISGDEWQDAMNYPRSEFRLRRARIDCKSCNGERNYVCVKHEPERD